ncbi:MAG: nucleotidyltransferase family protein [Chitinophagales bacterium]
MSQVILPPTKERIIEELSRYTREIESFSVVSLGLFGSVVRGQASSSSDIDFVVVLREKSFQNFIGLKIFMEDLLHRKIDLVIFDSIKPRLKDIILREVVYVPGFDSIS